MIDEHATADGNHTLAVICRGGEDRIVYSFTIPKRYSNLEFIAAGSQGVVGSAYDSMDQRRVAIKKLCNRIARSQNAIRTIREFKLLSSLNHPNIVKSIAVFTPQENEHTFRDVYVVMELMKHTLSEIILKVRLDHKQLSFFIYQILWAVNHLHRQGIIHRDLKPSNIAVNEKGVVKILDFGMARLFDSTAASEMTGYVATRYYRAPDVLLGDLSEDDLTHLSPYSENVDMWSIGCIFAELITGKVLFRGSDRQDQWNQIIMKMGTPSGSYIFQLPETIASQVRLMPRATRKPIDELIADSHFAFPEYPAKNWTVSSARNLISKMIEIDYKDRYSAAEALQHPYVKCWARDEEVNAPLSNSGYQKEVDEKKLTMQKLRTLIFQEVKHFEASSNRLDDKINRLKDELEKVAHTKINANSQFLSRESRSFTGMIVMLPRKPDREENNEAASKCRAYDVQAIIIGAKYKDSFIRMKKEYLDVLNQNASHLDFLIENDRHNAHCTTESYSVQTLMQIMPYFVKNTQSVNTSDKKERSEQKQSFNTLRSELHAICCSNRKHLPFDAPSDAAIPRLQQHVSQVHKNASPVFNTTNCMPPLAAIPHQLTSPQFGTNEGAADANAVFAHSEKQMCPPPSFGMPFQVHTSSNPDHRQWNYQHPNAPPVFDMANCAPRMEVIPPQLTSANDRPVFDLLSGIGSTPRQKAVVPSSSEETGKSGKRLPQGRSKNTPLSEYFTTLGAKGTLPVLSPKDMESENMNITPTSPESSQATVANKCDTCGYSFDLESARPKPWKCVTCAGFWPVPRCGGGWIVDGVEYTVKNTCSLDAFLAILLSQNKKNPAQYKNIGRDTKFEKYLRALLLSPDVDAAKEDLIECCYNHRLTEVMAWKKSRDSRKYLNLRYQTTYNLYGAELENLVASEAKPWSDVIAEIVHGFGFVCKKNGDIAGEICGGTRKMLEMNVRAWVIPVDLAMLKLAPQKAADFPSQIDVGGNTFELGGISLYDHEIRHFVSIIPYQGNWIKYDGMRTVMMEKIRLSKISSTVTVSTLYYFNSK